MAIILIDADETIEGLLKPWVSALNQAFNKNINWKSIRSWDMADYYPDISKVDMLEFLNDAEFWKQVKPLKGAVKYIKKLKDEGNQIYIVTSSHYKTIEAKTEQVILKYFDYLTWDNIIVCKDKQMIKGDILVDDYYNNLINGDYVPILFNSPHNRNIPTDIDILRVANWEECYNLIHTIIDAKF